MESVLAELNKTTGIMGSFIVTEDGIMVASDFTRGLDTEDVGALASSIINTAARAAEKMDQGQIEGMVLETEKNKIFFRSSRVGYLVTITTRDANIGLVRVEMKNAVKKLGAFDLGD